MRPFIDFRLAGSAAMAWLGKGAAGYCGLRVLRVKEECEKRQRDQADQGEQGAQRATGPPSVPDSCAQLSGVVPVVQWHTAPSP